MKPKKIKNKQQHQQQLHAYSRQPIEIDIVLPVRGSDIYSP